MDSTLPKNTNIRNPLKNIMKKQGIIEGIIGFLGLGVWILWFSVYPALNEFWVYVPGISYGFLTFFMWKNREDFKVDEKMRKAYRNANLTAIIGGVFCAVIAYLTTKDAEWFSWGNWFVATMYFFICAHGAGIIQFRDREKLKNMNE